MQTRRHIRFDLAAAPPVDATLALWEAVLEAQGADGAWARLRGRIGAEALRQDVIALAEALRVGWDAHRRATEAAEAPVAPGFAAWFLRACVEVTLEGDLAFAGLPPGWLDRCAALRAIPAAVA